MAVNESRSMNDDLHSGVNDGRLKSITPDRGGVIDMAEVTVRANLLQTQYGMSDLMNRVQTPNVDNNFETGYAED
jgi:hypothetical protein